MGVYDYVNCHYPLPVAGANALTYQTKDTDAQFLDSYEIRKDGTLWHEEYDVEDRSDPNAEGLKGLIGCMTRTSPRWQQELLTGEVRFYDGNADWWVEFSAYFVRGQLKQLEIIEQRGTVPVRGDHDEA